MKRMNAKWKIYYGMVNQKPWKQLPLQLNDFIILQLQNWNKKRRKICQTNNREHIAAQHINGITIVEYPRGLMLLFFFHFYWYNSVKCATQYPEWLLSVICCCVVDLLLHIGYPHHNVFVYMLMHTNQTMI